MLCELVLELLKCPFLIRRQVAEVTCERDSSRHMFQVLCACLQSASFLGVANPGTERTASGLGGAISPSGRQSVRRVTVQETVCVELRARSRRASVPPASRCGYGRSGTGHCGDGLDYTHGSFALSLNVKRSAASDQ